MVSLILGLLLFVSIIGHLLQWFAGQSNRNIIGIQTQSIVELQNDKEQLAAEKKLLKEQRDGFSALNDKLQREKQDIINRWYGRPRGERGKFLKKSAQ